MRYGSTEELVKQVAGLLDEGRVLGWFQGRMEFGPRALGARSILGDPRVPEMQSTLNLKIKFRESFRPFAPAVLVEHAADYFELDRASPYMLLVFSVRQEQRLAADGGAELIGLDRLKRAHSTIPAVTHVDFSARVQTVSREDHPRFHRLLEQFYRSTGCPVLVNTSFNVRGEPIVRTPSEAYRCFRRTGMDYLVLGSYLIAKSGEAAAWSSEAEAGAQGTSRQAASEREERREARRFGAVLTALLAVLAAASYTLGHPGRGEVVAVASGAVALVALFFLPVWILVFRLWMKAAAALGRLISTLALGAAFYGVLTPAGLLGRLFGEPFLDTAWKDGRASAWRDKGEGNFTVDRYRRQY